MQEESSRWSHQQVEVIVHYHERMEVMPSAMRMLEHLDYDVSVVSGQLAVRSIHAPSNEIRRSILTEMPQAALIEPEGHPGG